MDINKLMKQAEAMQKQIEVASNKLNETEFEGAASNGLVKVVVLGNNQVKSIDIDKTILNPDDKELIEDLITIALNDTNNKIENFRNNSLSSVASSMGLPTK